VLQAAAYTVAQMSVGRMVVGFGVGSAAMVVPLYVAEVPIFSIMLYSFLESNPLDRLPHRKLAESSSA
jgi:ABC-type methionine transport system permease subunit